MKEYLFKTLISFILLNVTFYITKDSWVKFTTKKHGFFKRLFNRLVFCLIPVFRWIWIVLVLFIGLLLSDEEYSNKVKQRMNEKENQELKKQVSKGLYNTCLPYTTGYNKAIKDKETQQKEFIKYLEDMLDDKNDMFSVVRVIDVLQKYKEIVNGTEQN